MLAKWSGRVAQAGKGRTGVMIAAYLLYAGVHSDPERSMHFFRTARTTDLDAVNNPGQCAYVRAYAQLLAAPPAQRPVLIRGRTITLHAVTISSAPATLSAMVATPPSAAARPPSIGNDSATADGAAGPPLYPAAVARDESGGSSVAALASMVVPPWHLKLSLYCLHTVDTPEGVRSVRSHVCSVGPLRVAPSQPHVRFALPEQGLQLRGDVQLSLFSAAGILVNDDELGWAHIHTSWWPEEAALEEAAPAAAAVAPEAAVPGAVAPAAAEPEAAAPEAAAPSVAPPAAPPRVRRAMLSRDDVDKVNKDGRFPADWTLTLEHSIVEEGEEVEAEATASPTDIQ
jgi:hypothetical protein